MCINDLEKRRRGKEQVESYKLCHENLESFLLPSTVLDQCSRIALRKSTIGEKQKKEGQFSFVKRLEFYLPPSVIYDLTTKDESVQINGVERSRSAESENIRIWF